MSFSCNQFIVVFGINHYIIILFVRYAYFEESKYIVIAIFLFLYRIDVALMHMQTCTVINTIYE